MKANYKPVKYNRYADSDYAIYSEIENIQDFLDGYLVYSKELVKLRQHKARRNSDAPKRKKYLYDSINVITVDTETSTVEDKDFAFSYKQMITINCKITIFTNTIQELGKLLNDINRWYAKHGLTDIDGFKAVIWCHNFSYDFQFLLDCCEIDFTLSRKKRDVIYATDANRCFMFKDSYALLGTSLARAAKDYKTEHKKLKGDLIYSLCRTPNTPLSEEEQAYCICDTVVLCEIISILLRTEGYGMRDGKFLGFEGFPNTKTGLVRNYIAKYIKDHKLEKVRANLFKKQFISAPNYRKLKKAYQGGYTHAFCLTKGKIMRNVKSFDKTSDYPYQLVVHKYPCNKFTKSSVRRFMDKLKSTKGKFENDAFLITFEMWDVEATSVITTISHSKVSKDIKNAKLDNGKVYKCDYVKITCTEQDFVTYMDTYKFKSINFVEVLHSEKDYLPEWIIASVFEFYGKKTTLKDVTGEEVMYAYFKQLLNSIYGCCVQDPCKEAFEYVDGIWESAILETDEDIEKKLNSRKQTVSYQWGVWVTAYARKELIDVMLKIDPEDLVYCDTDSCKFVEKKKYLKMFKQLNINIQEDNKRVSDELYERYGFTYDDFCPKNNKGEAKELGLWDDEGTYTLFKSTGAKRYITYQTKDKSGEFFHCTCCGIAKPNIRYQIIIQNGYKPTDITGETDLKIIKKIMESFKTGFKVEGKFDENGNSLSGKMVHTYFDNVPNNTFEVTDYLGNKETVYAKNFITLRPAEFSLTANEDFVDTLNYVV